MTRPAPRAHLVENHNKSWHVQGRTGWREPVRIKGRLTLLHSRCFVAKIQRRTEMRLKSHVFQWIGSFSFWLRKKGKVLISEFFFVLVWLRVPIYLVLFRLKFSSLCGHMIKCSLIELGRAGRENIWSRSWSKDLAAVGPYVMISTQILSLLALPLSQ